MSWYGMVYVMAFERSVAQVEVETLLQQSFTCELSLIFCVATIWSAEPRRVAPWCALVLAAVWIVVPRSVAPCCVLVLTAVWIAVPRSVVPCCVLVLAAMWIAVPRSVMPCYVLVLATIWNAVPIGEWRLAASVVKQWQDWNNSTCRNEGPN
jgi:ABC-type iron transport system FetAB permease component